MAEDGLVFQPPKDTQKGAHCSSMEQYRQLYERSVQDPEGFWGEIAKEFYFKKLPSPGNFLSYNFDARKGAISIKWMEGAITNVCYNMLDRNVNNGLGDRVAFYW